MPTTPQKLDEDLARSKRLGDEGTWMRFRTWRWWGVVLRGVAAIIFGLVSLWAPAIGLLAMVIVFGAYAIVDGALALSLALREPEISHNMLVLRGIVSVVAGVIALVLPGITAFLLLLVIGVWAIVAGILEIMMAIRYRKEIPREWLLALEGAISLAFGILLLAWPMAGLLALGLWIGIYALVYGVLLVAAGVRMRSRDRHPAPPPGALAAV